MDFRKEKSRGLIKLFLLGLVCIVAVAVCACVRFEGVDGDSVKVSLLDCPGVTVDGESVKEVKLNGRAEFKIEIASGYIYVGNSAGAEYRSRDGKLTLNGVKYPTSIEIWVVNTNNMLQLDIVCELENMITDNSVYMSWFNQGDSVVLSAKDSAAHNFQGWSVGGYLTEGGTLVSDAAEYSFTMEPGLKLYANYITAELYTIVYHANGGVVAENGAELKTVTTKRESLYKGRNTVHSDGTFKRDGYVAVGYSTEPVEFEQYATVNAIPGFSNMGGVCVVSDETCRLDLYVVWAKETPNSFYYKKEGGKITITGYRGSSSVAVIPANIQGLPVTKIDTGAFNRSTVKNVVIPDTVTEIADGAFTACTSLRQLVFFDSITEVSNASFTGCTALSTLVLNSQQLPVYSGESEGSFCLKYERVITAPGKMLVVVSGSSTMHGMVSSTFQEAYPEHTIINYGTNAGTSTYFYLEMLTNYVGTGDIIINAGEHGSTTMGLNQITWKLFRGNEQCYDIFREVDMTGFYDFWAAFAEFQNERSNQSGKSYQLPCPKLNEYGDYVKQEETRTFSFSKYDFSTPSNYLKESNQNVKRLNSVNAKIVSLGGIMLGSFATLDVESVVEKSRTQAVYNQYTDYFKEKLDYPIISNVGDYVLAHEYFFDSQWHCNNTGAALRTERLLADMKKYFDANE